MNDPRPSGDPDEELAAERSARERLELALEVGGDGFALFEEDSFDGVPRLRLVHGNAVACAAFGLLVGERLGPCLAPRPSARVWGLLWDAIRQPTATRPPAAGPVDGRRRARVDLEPVGTGAGYWDVTVAPAGPHRALVTWRDATDGEAARRALADTAVAVERAVTHDAVTELPTGAVLRGRLADLLARRRHGRAVAVVLCSLNGLAESAGARYGCPVSDGLLLASAERLRGLLRHGDLAARIGGDTFGLVLSWPEPGPDPAVVLGRIAAALNRPVAVRSTLLAPTVSLGLVLADPAAGLEPDRDADDLLLRAYEAMQRSRTRGEPVVAVETDREAERARLAALAAYDVHDGALDEVFRSTVHLAAAACAAPYAVLSFVDADLEWVRATSGPCPDVAFGAHGPRHLALSDATIRGRGTTVLRDLRDDPRCHTRHVSWQQGMEFYAAAPLVDREGRAVGALAVLDEVPRDLTSRQRHTLTTLADEIMGILEARRARRP